MKKSSVSQLVSVTVTQLIFPSSYFSDFWDKVPYLDNQEVYPASNEQAGYMVGFADNIGDALTFKIYNDQSQRIVCASVICPYNDN